MYEALFGNKVVESSRLYIVNYGEGGILVSQFRGNIRVFTINPRLGIKIELAQLCEKVLSLYPEKKTQEYFRERRRPRRKGKKL